MMILWLKNDDFGTTRLNRAYCQQVARFVFKMMNFALQ